MITVCEAYKAFLKRILTLLPYLIINYEVRGEKVTKCGKDIIKLVKLQKCWG